MLLGSPYFLSQLGSVFEYYKMIHNALLTAINYLLKGISNLSVWFYVKCIMFTNKIKNKDVSIDDWYQLIILWSSNDALINWNILTSMIRIWIYKPWRWDISKHFNYLWGIIKSSIAILSTAQNAILLFRSGYTNMSFDQVHSLYCNGMQ